MKIYETDEHYAFHTQGHYAFHVTVSKRNECKYIMHVTLCRDIMHVTLHYAGNENLLRRDIMHGMKIYYAGNEILLHYITQGMLHYACYITQGHYACYSFETKRMKIYSFRITSKFLHDVHCSHDLSVLGVQCSHDLGVHS